MSVCCSPCVCVQVVAVDQDTDGLSSTAQLNITVLDYNDNTPQFPPIPDPVEIPEGNYSEESPREVSFFDLSVKGYCKNMAVQHLSTLYILRDLFKVNRLWKT